jgi:hypothetical protein
VLTATLVGALLSASMPSASALTNVSGSDPTFDNPDNFDGRGDITGQAGVVGGGSYALAMTVRTWANPSTDSGWVDFFTEANWALDVDLDDDIEGYAVVRTLVDGTVIGEVVDADDNFVCDATPGWNAATQSYSISFDQDCIVTTTGVWISAGFTYENGAGESFDTADWIGPLTPTVATAPGAPTNVKITPQSGALKVTWGAAPANGSAITGYTVTAVDGNLTFTATAPGNATTATVTGLLNGSTYAVSVTATNGIGTGPASAPVNGKPGNVPGAPTNVKATPAIGGATVTWTSPPTGGHPITGFTVTPNSGASVNVAGNKNSAFVPLPAGTYTLRVAAKNAVGTGPLSAPSNAVNVKKVGSGYWMLGSTGAVFGFGDARNLGNGPPLSVALAPRRDGSGYWVTNIAGQVVGRGSATTLGAPPSLSPGEFVSTISATPNGDGYWLFTNRGRAIAYGNAAHYGDMRGVPLAGPIIASVATATGKGYWMVGSDGGIFSFGDARFHGSMGGIRLNRPVVGISPTPDNKGYWLVASDGGVFAFNAPFRGSMGSTPLNKPVNGLVAFGNGYLMVASDGGIFTFSDRPFFGSLGGSPPPYPIVGAAAFAA